MIFTTIYLENNKIEIHNSLLGKETIKVNDAIVSSKSSITGTEHTFNVIENGTESNCKVILGYGLNGVVFDFYKNDRPVIESPKSGWQGILLIVFIAAITIGLLGIVF